MLNLFAPHSNPRTHAASREEIRHLCRHISNPSFPIPAGADLALAEALLSREYDNSLLVNATMQVLYRNPQVANILNLAWEHDEPGLDQLLSDGTLIAFLNAPLVRALLCSSAIPNISFDRLFTHVRKRLLDCAIDSKWSSSPETLSAAISLSVHAFLTEHIFLVSSAESEAVTELHHRVEGLDDSGVEPFDVAVMGCYRPLHELNVEKMLKTVPQLLTEPSLRAFWRIQVADPEKEGALAPTIPCLTAIEDRTSQDVRAMYEENPYPRWVSYALNEPSPPEAVMREVGVKADLSIFTKGDQLDILVAGCGTGQAAIADAVLWNKANVHAVDLSLASLAFGMRCADELDLLSIEFAQADILELPTLGRSYDYISSGGVLHHMADPFAGWQALSDVCRPGGMMRLSLYSEAARSAVRASSAYVKTLSADQNEMSIPELRQRLISHAHKNGEVDDEYKSVFFRFDFYTTSMFRDLLMHVSDFEFTIPKIKDAIDRLGLKFCGFVDPDRSLITRYRSFSSNDPDGLDLETWHQFETKYPDTFARMYDFMVQKPLH